MSNSIKVIFLLISIIFLGACSTKYLNINQVLDEEQHFSFKGKSKLYSKKDKKYLDIFFIEYSHYESIAKNKVKENCLDYIKKNKLKHVECKFFGTEFTERILVAID